MSQDQNELEKTMLCGDSTRGVPISNRLQHLRSMDVAKHLLAEPAPDVVGGLIGDLRRAYGLLLAAETLLRLCVDKGAEFDIQEEVCEWLATWDDVKAESKPHTTSHC